MGTAEVYKQLDQLREENFALKKNQRELILQINGLKDENESLVKNADVEIKRMSEFIESFTVEVEKNKISLEQEYQEKISQERRKFEELRRFRFYFYYERKKPRWNTV